MREDALQQAGNAKRCNVMRDTKNIIRNGKATKMDERSHVSRDNEHQSLLKLHGHVITQK